MQVKTYHSSLSVSNGKPTEILEESSKTREKVDQRSVESGFRPHYANRVVLPEHVFEMVCSGELKGQTLKFWRAIDSLSIKYGFCFASDAYLAAHHHPSEEVRLGVLEGDERHTTNGIRWVQRQLKALRDLNLIRQEGGGVGCGVGTSRRLYPFADHTKEDTTRVVVSPPNIRQELSSTYDKSCRGDTTRVVVHTYDLKKDLREDRDLREDYPELEVDHDCSATQATSLQSHASRVGHPPPPPPIEISNLPEDQEETGIISVASSHPPSMQDSLESAIERRKPSERKGLEGAVRKMCAELELAPADDGETLISQRDDMEHLRLKPRELVSLIVGFKQRGLNGVHLEACCQHLSDYIANNRKGQKYKNHAAAIRSWVLEKVLRERKFSLDLERSETDLERSQVWLEKAMEG